MAREYSRGLTADPSAARSALAHLVDDSLLADTAGEFDQFCTDGSGADGVVVVSTIHGARCREWDHVIVAGSDEGTLPMPPRGGGDEVHMAQALCEEARLCYVAMTRSRKTLTFTSGSAQPSRFLGALPAALVRHDHHAEPASQPPEPGLGATGHTMATPVSNKQHQRVGAPTC
jgi:superfamily I DNA/RNA helicase